ncbi:WPE palindromic element domain-containing protein [Wolbachia endosymbiont of Drosophila tsacasi]|nr:WPE palindromic element domain-containing protein [Wolbachia endosymbiont of Drosophila tsacasi]MDE5061991.1 WPE palindromic element domain-containing protein [Wolbachia endosymbiont of Drosophila tsacasi]
MPRHWDPEDVISTKWLHNKGWIPVPSIGMTSQRHWNDTSLGLF